MNQNQNWTHLRWWQRVSLLAVVGAVLTVSAVFPQLSARATGAEYRLAVAPVDPIDPFRGAYVTLSYPGLNPDPNNPEASDVSQVTGRHDVYVPLVRQQAADPVWTFGEHRASPPSNGPFLKCSAEYGQTDCGIDSWFMPQAEAAGVQADLAADRMVAVVKVDGRGNAALVDLRRK